MTRARAANTVLAAGIAALAMVLAWRGAIDAKLKSGAAASTLSLQRGADDGGKTPAAGRGNPAPSQQLARTLTPQATTRVERTPPTVRRESVESGTAALPATLRPHVAAQAPVGPSPRSMVGPAGGTVLDRSLLTARACWLEAEFSLPDCAAIVSVLQLRAERSGWTYERMLWAYTALRRKNPRAAFARALPDGDVPGWTYEQNAEWYELRALATDALQGDAPSPCPKNTSHWGGLAIVSDAERARGAVNAGRWRRVRCNGKLENAFFAETRVKALSAAEARPR